MVSANTTVQVLTPSGILDGTQAEEIRSQVDHALSAGATTLLMDLKDTTFVDSSGLGTLVSVLKKLRAQGGDMFVCSINPQVKMLFELTSMDQVFQIFKDREAFEISQ
ncbi:MAG: anti-sigma B factor antagonist [Phormidesmis priestleyi Ana]|uniref:Anti-sigma factor antagonist n=1 Tax=Phormidesmis priestleyi Ana TaxID=1666911 RepID=A0A0N8KN91_9CYAN|nr:MAG: anti-sigma B factor antagonist [Phormidesmis priestleyi Ana]